jgi:hypothetical protein
VNSSHMFQMRMGTVQRPPSGRCTLYSLPVTFMIITACFSSLAFNSLGYSFIPSAKASGGTAYYVSKNGNNANGRSWATAWNELANLNWSAVQPGDTILLDGGSQSMTYTTTLTVGKSGTPTAPITIERATDAGHNGAVILFGGRSTPLPYCGQKNYEYQPAPTSHGIVFGASSWVVIDGISWGGINIHGFSDNGIDMTGSPRNDTLRNMEIYDNGPAIQSGGTWYPDTGSHGIYLTGSNLTFERMNIHDNSDDEFDTGEPAGVHNITIDLSWLHNTREDPTRSGVAFNDCVHTDGYQIYSGFVQSNITVENSIVGPGLGDNFILGATKRPDGNSATINNVTISNVLTIGKDRNILGFPQVLETGWVIDHVTAITQGSGISGGTYEALFLQGSNNTVTNSIFYGGLIYLPDGLVKADGNCHWKTAGDSSVLGGQTVDPQFTTDISSYNYHTHLSTNVNTNFALQPTSPCKGAGSSITSVYSFLQRVTTPTPTPMPKSTAGSTQKPVVIATPVSPPTNNATVFVVVLGFLIFIVVISLFIVLYRKSRNSS